MSNRLSNDNGFTLIELLIALTIFSIGLLAIAGLQIRAINFNTGSNMRTSTTALAQGVMEQVMALASNDPLLRINGANNATIDPNNLDGDNDVTTLVLPGGGALSATWIVTVDNPVNGMSRIDVTAQESAGRAVTLTSFKRYNN
jgi:type IV pilus assembly protein PilV